MRILLDENLPKTLKLEFQNVEAFTVRDRGWQGKSNGELIRLMMADNFDALMTFDKNLQHQQNFLKYPMTVFVLNAQDNTYETLKALVPKIKTNLSGRLRAGVIEIKI